MIQTENLIIDNNTFVRTWSNEGRYVIRDGIEYEEAIDPIQFNRIYTEGNIISRENSENDDYAEAGRILIGDES